MTEDIEVQDIDEIEEYLEKENFNGELEIYLSTDGKHTVHLKTSEPDKAKRKEMIAKAMELYDFVLARYGTKQAQAVKEYSHGNGHDKPDQETCTHPQFKFAQVKKEGPNTGKWFKSCAQCGKFLGWQ
ncbi:hypothetical protein HY345_01720 [Candidatus Microgenomates bacterium]|nr:hypothetical protein [Candidatus Microgenomates bacterium]